MLRNICGALGRQVLLVDDDDMMRRGMRSALEQDGWQVSEAENGRVALARLADTRPDIIMLDLVMPEMDGFEFLVEMRSRAEWRDIPVLVVTAKDLTAEERMPPERRRGARAAERRRRAPGIAAGDRPCSAPVRSSAAGAGRSGREWE